MSFCLRDILFFLFMVLMFGGLAGFSFWVGSVWKEGKMKKKNYDSLFEEK